MVATAATVTWAWMQPVQQPAAAPAAVPSGGAADTAVACPEAGGNPVTEPQLTFPARRLDDEQAAAARALADRSAPLPCGAVADHGHVGHGRARRSPAPPQRGADGERFRAQWAAAGAAAGVLATPEQAAAAGYVQASPQAAGVGTHWIDWRLIDAPFDPARPSMLLFDQRPGRPPHLVGFSYWVRSSSGPPEGFAGRADVWHVHLGLCFIDGWLFSEDIPSADGCSGDWLNGSDLWMLHAWVVDDFENRAGPFAARNEALCPGDRERIADALRCDPTGN